MGHGLEGFKGLGWSQSCLIVHIHFLPIIPALLLYCIVHLSCGKVLPYFHLVSRLQPKLSLSHRILITIVLGYYHPSLSVITKSSLAPQPCSCQYLRRTLSLVIFWELRVPKDLPLDHCFLGLRRVSFSHSNFPPWPKFKLVTFINGSAVEISFYSGYYLDQNKFCKAAC